MTAVSYLFLLLTMSATAAAGDALWVGHIRPLLAPRFGWPDLEPDELIPAGAWIGMLVVLFLLFVFVPFVGAAVGF